MKTIVALSYFHRKIGPIVFYAFPKQELDDQLSARIANIMDQTVSEGYFTLTFEDKISKNYYFEIHSDWARGNNEMVMVSLVFEHQISEEVDKNLRTLCEDFCSKLQANEEIYTAFYISDINNMEEDEKSLIIKNNELVKGWVKELYWATIEETRRKSEEEKIASLLNKRHIFLTMRKLSKGPISLEELDEWFNEEFHSLSFKELMDTLVERQLIFINQIGFVERYVLLLKEVNAERIPPDSVIEFLEEAPEEVESGIIDILLPKVQEYFSLYENKSEKELEEDSYILFQIISDSKKYNVFSELRNGLIPKDKIPQLIPKKTLNYLNESLDFLKLHNIIEEIKYNDERYLVLKTNIQITTAFPEYLRKLLPKETKPVVAKKYKPKHR